jgi:glucan phosphorylase
MADARTRAAHDVPVLGYHVNTRNRLRLWRAEACESFDFHAFNAGDFHGAVEQKVASETLSKVLYPNDGTDAGRRLRLKQQAFFVSCSLQDMLRNLRKRGMAVTAFADHWAVQLNDTHPAIAVGVTPRRWLALANPPLNTLLLDVLGPGWPGQPEALRRLEPLAEDGAFLERWHRAKLK